MPGAAAAIFATAAGTYTAASVLGGIAMIGTGLSAVGMITGNKGLMKFGGAMGLVGGLGSLAAGALSSAGSAAGATAEGAAGAAGAATEGMAASAGMGTTLAENLAAPTLGELGSGTSALTQGLGGEVGGSLLNSNLSSQGGLAIGELGGNPAFQSLAPGADGLIGSAMSGGIPGLETAGAVAAPAAESAGKGVFGEIGGFLKDNKELVQLGGNMMKGAAEQKNAKDVMKMKLDYEKALQQGRFDEAERLRQQYNSSVAGTSIPMQANPGANINPTGQTFQDVMNARMGGGILNRRIAGAT